MDASFSTRFPNLKLKKMARAWPSQLIFLLFLACLAVADARPGFLYVRTRGRCTPQYWSSRREAWPRMVPETATVSKVFGSRAFERYRHDLTLLEAAEEARNDESGAGDTFRRLVEQSTAALLNSYAREGFPYSPWEVKTLLIQALVSERAAAVQAQRFFEANDACN